MSLRKDPVTSAAEMLERGFKPLVVYPGANTPWKCRCLACKSIVTPRYSTVVSRGLGGCDKCAKRAAGETRRREAEGHIIVALAEYRLTPQEPYPGALKPWQIKCDECRTEFSARWNQIQQGRRCPVCTQRKKHERHLAKESARAVTDFRLAGLDPIDSFKDSYSPWLATCMKCGDVVSPRLAGVRAGQGGCITCGRKQRGLKRRVSDGDARELMEAALLRPDPEIPYPGSNAQWPSTCLTCGAHVKPRYSNIKKGWRGCRRCAMVEGGVGFDVWNPGIIYLLKHDNLGALKVGITSTNSRHDRLQVHSANGWRTIKTWKTKTGQDAVYVEGILLAWIRNELELYPFVDATKMPQGGWTETLDASKMALAELKARIQHEVDSVPPLPALPSRDASKIGRRIRCPIILPNGNQCRRKAQVGDLCASHARRLELFGDATRYVPSKGDYCEVMVDGEICGQPVRSRSMCSVHYDRHYRTGDATTISRQAPGSNTTCHVEYHGAVCGKKAIAQGYCTKHYAKWRKYGDPLAGKFENPGAQCSVVENRTQCEGSATAREMCGRHYSRWRSHGDPLVIKRVPR
jgi:hypothetical protein